MYYCIPMINDRTSERSFDFSKSGAGVFSIAQAYYGVIPRVIPRSYRIMTDYDVFIF